MNAAIMLGLDPASETGVQATKVGGAFANRRHERRRPFRGVAYLQWNQPPRVSCGAVPRALQNVNPTRA
ncbi:hypothetical protein GCM10023332_18950 [Luteimonas vadosa]|uniref:IS110 family transposase n=1 Tax=Luteimonas vadosa TaxID=1165507 RepID=A0ABP9E4B6_9GAMM